MFHRCQLKFHKENFAGSNNHSSSIKFVDVHLHSSPELPPDYQFITAPKISHPNFSHLMPLLMTAFDEVRNNFRDIHRELKAELVIYDMLQVQPWAPAVAREEKIPSVLFLCSAAASYTILLHCNDNPKVDYPISELNFPRTMNQEIVQFLHIVNGLAQGKIPAMP